MKKIMFNNKYGLDTAVLNGSKTMTRRFVTQKDLQFYKENKKDSDLFSLPHFLMREMRNKFKENEIVAIAQSYKDAGIDANTTLYRTISKDGYQMETAGSQKGWNNKMFVGSEIMPHRIKITKVWVQKLQDISEEDCVREGMIKDKKIGQYKIKSSHKYDEYECFNSAKKAFACLIDKLNGKGTWEDNPYVFVYEFKLIK